MSLDDQAVPNGSDGAGGRPEPAVGEKGQRAPSIWRRRGARTAILCGGFLVVGMGLGSLITSMVVHRMIRRGFRDPGRIASHVLDRMRDDLDLTDEQAAKILPVLKKHIAGIRDAMRGSHDAMHEEIEPLLTPEQLAEHRRISAERKARLFGHGRGHH